MAPRTQFRELIILISTGEADRLGGRVDVEVFLRVVNAVMNV
jgi:hypothetical protein